MKRMRISKLLMTAFAAASAFVAVTFATDEVVFADENSNSKVVSEFDGNYFGAGTNVDFDNVDCFGAYGAGQNISFSNSTSDSSVALAGMNVSVTDSDIDGTLFMGGYNVNVRNTDVDGNMVAAGACVTLDENSKCRTAVVTGQEVTILGECESVNISGEYVKIGGVINGDASIYAVNVEFLDGALVKGKCEVTSKESPSVSGAAEVENIEYKETLESEVVDERIIEETAEKGTKFFKIFSLFKVVRMLGMILLGVLFSTLMGGVFADATELLKNKYGPMFGYGACLFFGIPIAAVILCITVVGIPISIIAMIAYALIVLIASAFGGAVIGRLAFERMHPTVAAAIGVAIVQIFSFIPIIGGIAGVACDLILFGYIMIKIVDKRKATK